MQSACMSSLMVLAEKDAKVLYLTSDSGEGGLDRLFKMSFPKQSFDFGIAECNMVAAAAGLATAGKIPFIYSPGPFMAYRAMEFIRNDVCFQNLNVNFLAVGSGLSVSALGPTHHTTEDISVLRAIPNLEILSPATPKQVEQCVLKAYATKGPVYIRVGMGNEIECFDESYSLDKGFDILREGEDGIIFTTGSILSEVLAATDLLKEEGVCLTVINVVRLKPFDTVFAYEQIKNAKTIFTVEEHNVYGGLGGIIAEVITDNASGAKLKRIGLEDRFAVGYGKIAQLREENGLDKLSLVRKIREGL